MKDLESMPKEALLTAAEVREVVRVSTMTIWRWVDEGHFPTPVKLGTPPAEGKKDTRRNFFRVSEVREWLNARASSGGPQAA